MKFLSILSLFIFVFVSFSLALTINRNEKTNAISVNSVKTEPSNQTNLKKLKKEIEREIGKPRAKRLSQCRVIAFGAKACGGPKSYLLYSTFRTNENKLKRLVDQYNSIEDKINKESEAMSDCMIIEEPKVSLINGICKIK